MKILSASWIITCNEDSAIIKDGAIVFDEKIIDVGTKEFISEKYKGVEIESLGQNSVLMPGLINSHVHLEFSSNSTTLKYGNFMQWLNSVIASREELVEKASSKLISKKLSKMLKSGTTTIGAISSYSLDMEACINSAINTVYFTEVIGSKADMIDTLFADFKARLNSAKSKANKSFIPAIAIHSPYSVHPFLVRETLNLAREENLSVSSHFLESPEEFEWLHRNEGGFLEFFKNFLGQEKSVTEPMEFLNQFTGLKNLSFTHCVEASDNDLLKIKELKAFVNHCVTSNRLLNNTKLNIDKLIDLKVPFTIGTDGLSSNNSLSMFDELRNCLMIHLHKNPISFSKTLLQAATLNGAKALGLEKGELSKDKDADIIAITLPDKVKEKEDLCMNVILHTKFVNKVYIGGNDV
ncbi:aminofutalosine deaminase family hydrolase [Halarcobacter bivalviorum]|uniref:Chlorohydrolase n=1 Tax=Halarcobacter bivalviorum TaxID=663364 RepID=A0AAX2A7D6_9BACT|nr:metal-dependent hydrolase [Halarcobacter bivalviorum]AXH11593.1 metallo-dependent hydrolase, subgroup D [Halarcobacter bivalviorum]RXK08918.1 chlorohydrolase [Halarcobacter bivalviorum]